MKTVKLISLLLSLLLIFGFVSCAETTDGEDSTSEREYEFPDISSEPSPLSIDGVEVPYSLFRYYFSAVAYGYDQGDPDYWKTHDLDERVREEVLHYVQLAYAVEAMAKEYGQELTDYEKDEVEATFNQSKYSFATTYEFHEMLDSNFLTEEVFRFTLENDALYGKLFEYMKSEGSGYRIKDSEALAVRFFENYVYRADHIVVLHSPGEDINENITLINEIYEKLNSGESFSELKKKYSEDEDTNDTDVGVYVYENENVLPEYLEAVKSMEEGETSGIIEAPYGWFIVKRLPLDMEYIEANMDYTIAYYQSCMFSIMLEDVVKEQNVVLSDSFYTYTPETLK